MTDTKKTNIKKKVVRKNEKPKLVTSPKIPETKWKFTDFLENCKITEEDIKNSSLEWNELTAIYEDHKSRINELEDVAKYFADRLRNPKAVHSIRYRIKSPQHLVRKIIRKNTDAKKRRINYFNYKNEITDLIGLRTLHLYKEDWKPIHDFIGEVWNLHEKPTAYIRKGDRRVWIEQFSSSGCLIKEHPRNYRSIHYIAISELSKNTIFAEIQVRTLFEEGWSEIDHRINYPEGCNPLSIFFLDIFNRLAGSADEMGSFLNMLVKDTTLREEAFSKLKDDKAKAMKDIEELVNKLKISEEDKKDLQSQLNVILVKQATSELKLAGYIKTYQPLIGKIRTFIPGLSDLTFDTSKGFTNYCNLCGKSFKTSLSYLNFGYNICPDCQKKNK